MVLKTPGTIRLQITFIGWLDGLSVDFLGKHVETDSENAHHVETDSENAHHATKQRQQKRVQDS
jgi:hypothetical protein